MVIMRRSLRENFIHKGGDQGFALRSNAIL
jgi:hypothetical protein